MGKDIKFKRVVIKEELVKLTGNYKLAVTLNQLLYWQERVDQKRWRRFVEEELNRDIDDTEGLKGGWIYKKSEELAEELMMDIKGRTVRNWLLELIERGYILQRDNPMYKWDNTKQYRVNLLKIQADLKKLGYQLEGFKDIFEMRKKLDNPRNGRKENISIRNEENSTRSVDKFETIPEITSENTLTENTRNNNRDGNGKDVSTTTIPLKKAIKKLNPSSYEIENVKYYLEKYREVMDKPHPQLKLYQWKKVFEQICFAEGESYNREFELLDHRFKVVVDQHFKTKYNNGDCDYSILHFISGEIMINRTFEVAY